MSEAITVKNRVMDPALQAFAEEVGSEGAVAVRGGGTRWETGGAVADDARIVTAPEGIVQYTPAEMTIRVRAGTTVSDLHAALGQYRQRTALPDRGGTVGGALSVGENDLEVLGKGRVRTCALEVTYVSADGQLVTGGGPTVKNVSGFDLPRLMVGSLGTLGLLSEVILRTNPLPAVRSWLQASDADPFSVRDQLQAPSAVLWDGHHTWVLLEGHAKDVESQHSTLHGLGTFAAVEGPPDEMPAHRWSLAPADLRRASDMFDGPFVASVGVGTVFASTPQPPRTPSAAVQQVADRMKHYFDPTARLNPGRNPGDR